MGSGVYSSVTRSRRSESLGFMSKSAREIFTERNINSEMDPHGVKLRESRDSDDHPCSIPILLALDVTGSMGSVPHFLVKHGLPDMMEKIINGGVPDPQVLFMGIGDHECDKAPLQIGQFESSDEMLDHWLTKLFIEGGGGGNYGESYLLAWFFAAHYTSTDHFEKRRKKGIIFTIGDEPTLMDLPTHAQKQIMGPGQYQDLSAAELLAKARETYEVFHLHIAETSSGSRQNVQDGWKQLMGGDVVIVHRKEEVSQIIADMVLKVVTSQNDHHFDSNLDQGPKPTVDSDGGDGPMML